MRSSLSYILTNQQNDIIMSTPDYKQTPKDHGALLILIHRNDENNEKSMEIYEKIMEKNEIIVKDSQGCKRTIFFKYINFYSPENNDWGNFQTHRRLLGLITIGNYQNTPELNEICRLHEILKVKYMATLYDTRCILIDGNSATNTTDTNCQQVLPTNFKTQTIFIHDNLNELDEWFNDYLNNLYWILESKRLERLHENKNHVTQLLVAPFERRDLIGLDLDSRSNRKKLIGRLTKNLADLTLQCGLANESQILYNSAIDLLKPTNDWLWLGACYEGYSAATIIAGKSADSIDAIVRFYRDSIVHYSKYQNAALIEIEASFKAANFTICQNLKLQTASFLQNICLINLNLTDLEKIERFINLSKYYELIEFKRKSAFYLRLTATRFVSPQITQPDWLKCYEFMLASLIGYHLDLDPMKMVEMNAGWPTLQIQLLAELVVAAKRMGQSALAVRHMTYLLQVMWSNLQPIERKDYALKLQSLSMDCDGCTNLLKFKDISIPPINLIEIPKLIKYEPKLMDTLLKPYEMVQMTKSMGPFLFTPINFGGGSDSNENLNQIKWVQNEQVQVNLKLINPLPFDLKMMEIKLLTNGSLFEPIPKSIVIPTNSGIYDLILMGTPHEDGLLILNGYSTHVLGIKSNCELDTPIHIPIIPNLPHLNIEPDVMPNLKVYHGEEYVCSYNLKNIGSIPVEFMEITQLGMVPNLKNLIQIKWSDDFIKRHIPLNVDTEMKLDLIISCVATFFTGLHCTSDLSSMVSSSYGGGGGGGTSIATSITTNRNVSLTSSQAMIGGQPSSLLLPPTNQMIEMDIQLKYSGGSGYSKAANCRLIPIQLNVTILPTLEITNWMIIASECLSEFYLILDLTNLTTYEMELKYTREKLILIESQGNCRIPIPIKRFPIENNMESNLTECTNYLIGQVELCWHLIGLERSGKCNLNGIQLTESMLDEICMSPVVWEIMINGNPLNVENDFLCETGDLLEFQIYLENSLENYVLENLILELKFFQDLQNGLINSQLDTRMAVAGSTKKILDRLDAHTKILHDLNVIIFTPGIYKIDVQCTMPIDDVMSSTTLQQQHVWRFTPSITVTVN